MRILIIILTLIISGSSAAQTLYPFQVLYAENAKLSDGKILKSMDMVSDKETIKISEEGYLALVHDSGFPIEVNRDTILAVNELHNSITKSAQKREGSFLNTKRISLDFIFLTNKKSAEIAKRITGACHDCDTEMEVIYPPNLNSRLFYSDDFCIEWKPFGKKNYQVMITNMFDDSLKSFIVENTKLTIPREEMKSIRGNEETLLLTIKSLGNHLTPQPYLIKFYFSESPNPYPCNITSSLSALLVGYYLETSRNDHSKEAEEYYKLSTKLSSKKFYQDMLANYYSRQGK